MVADRAGVIFGLPGATEPAGWTGRSGALTPKPNWLRRWPADREAFGSLLARWRPSPLCRRALGPGPQAEDVAHREGGASLAVHGAGEASLVGHYAAAKAIKDIDLMELSMTELFPEEEVEGVMFLALDQSGLRLEVALPFGFDQDPKAASGCLAATTEEIQLLLAADCADSGG